MPDTPRWKILIADDNAQNVELLEAYLADFPAEVAVARDGAETLSAVEAFKPDLVLLDVMMPKLSGFEVCKRLKSNPATKDVAVLMVTSLHETGDIERGVDAGTDDFLSKPINKQILLRRATALLRVRSLENELARTLAYLREVEGRAK